MILNRYMIAWQMVSAFFHSLVVVIAVAFFSVAFNAYLFLSFRSECHWNRLLCLSNDTAFQVKWIFFHCCILNSTKQDLFHAVVIVRDKFHICNCKKNNNTKEKKLNSISELSLFTHTLNAYIHAQLSNATKCTIRFLRKKSRVRWKIVVH